MDKRSKQYLEALKRAGRLKGGKRDDHLRTATEHFCQAMLMEMQASKHFDIEPQGSTFADNLTRFTAIKDYS